MGNIKVEVKNGGPCERTLSVQIAAEEFNSEREKVLRQFRKEARIPGFRPGKVPLGMIESRFKDSIKEETVQNLVSNSFREALEQEKINPLGQPRVENLNVGEDNSISFDATVEVFPELKLEKYTGFEVEKKLRQVTDEDVERALADVREQNAHFAPKEGAAEKGDYLVMTFCVLNDESEPEEGTRRENQLVMAGHEDPAALFSHALVGLTPGEGQELTVDFPPDYSEESLKGRRVRYRVDVQSVRQKVLPELDDSFAAQVSHADTLDKLRGIIRHNMEHEIEHRAAHQVEDDLLAQIIAANDFELPGSLIEDAVSRRAEYIKQQNRGQDFEEAELRKAVRPGAITSLKREFIFHELSHREKIEVSPEDISAKIEEYASQLGKPVAEVQKDFRSARSMNQLRSMLLEDKVLDFLKSNNTVLQTVTTE
ncbi:trigger factor [bacterium]|nr:trigger factor [bacterium]